MNASGTALENKSITAGTGVTINHTIGGIEIAATGSGGTVTSVTGTTNEITVDNTDPSDPVIGLSDLAVSPAGSYGSATEVPVVTIDAKGRVTGVTEATITGTSPIGSALPLNQVFIGDASNQAEARYFSVADLRNASGTQQIQACTSSQTLIWSSVTDTLACTSISVAHTQVSGLDAANVSNTAAGNISANDVQSAINELDSEKVSKAGDTMTGPLIMDPKGTSPGDGGSVALRELSANGTNSAVLRAPDSLAANYTLTLPQDAGVAGQVLTTDGNGILSWGTPSTGSGDILDGGNATGSTVIVGTNDVQDFQLETSNTPRLTVGSSGGVGIGTTATTGAGLTVTSSASGANLLVGPVDGANEGGQIRFAGSGSYSPWEIDVFRDRMRVSTSAPGTHVFQVYNGGGDLDINLDGRVMINNLGGSPSEALEVSGYIVSHPKGTASGQSGAILLKELAANGLNSAILRAPDSLAADYTLTLPVDDGTSGQVLSTNGSGILSWVTPSNASGDILDGGNTTGATVVVGTNDGQSFQLETNNSPRMTILSGGQVGIGTDNPLVLLDVADSDNDATIAVTNHNSTTGRYPSLSAGNYMGSTGAGYPMVKLFNRRGNSGLPEAVQANDVLGSIAAYGGNGDGYNVNSGGQIRFLARENFTTLAGGTDIQFLTTDVGSNSVTEKMRIVASGSVGIGTTNPTSTLHLSDTASNPSIRLDGVATGVGFYGPGSIELFRGDGTISPASVKSFIDFKSTALEDYDMRLHYSEDDGLYIANNASDGIGTSGYLFTIKRTGNVGIGTTNPTAKLQVGVSGDGSVAIANAWNTFSDIRLKTNITKIENACEIVDHLNGYYYNWKSAEDQSRQVGVIAQEVQDVLPELVREGPDGILTVDYPKLTAVLIEAVKEIRKENQSLGADNAGLREKNENMSRRLASVEENNTQIESENERIRSESEKIRSENKKIKLKVKRVEAENQELKTRLQKIEAVLGLSK